MVLSIDCLHMLGGPFLLHCISLHTTTATTTVTTFNYNNDNSPNMRNGSFLSCEQINLH